VILSNGKSGVYRTPTIREIACIMSFPVTYLFYGEDEKTKHKLVGNAVCPKVAFHFAKAILKKEIIKLSKPTFTKIDIPSYFNNLRHKQYKKRGGRPKHPLSNFAEIVPNLKCDRFRIELDNGFPRARNKVDFEWKASIHHATGKRDMKMAVPSKKEVGSLLLDYDKDRALSFMHEVHKVFDSKIPPSRLFQKQHCTPRPDKKFMTPRKALVITKRVLDNFFPEKKYKESFVNNINPLTKKIQFKFNRGKIPDNKIPIRIIAALFAVSHIAELTKKSPHK